MNNYADFLASKQRRVEDAGPPCDPADVHPLLHPWQRRIVAWAVTKGRAALWEDVGLGKTFQQIEWARLSGDRALIVAPLAVCEQTVREATKLGVEARYARDDSEADGPGLWITNYERVARFDPAKLDAVVLDESSILANTDGKTRTLLIRHFADVPGRLACSATPAPNDMEELTNHAEYLGVSSRVNMLAAYFVHDDAGWRVKGHAHDALYRWMSTWAVALRRPSDIGYPDAGYDLPGLRVIPHLLPVVVEIEGQLFATELGGVGGRAKVRKATAEARCDTVADLVGAEPAEPWVLWCGLNAEAERLAKLLPGSVNVHGAWSAEDKAQALLDFADGRVRYLITKPSIASFGLNWQHCARMAFVGLSDSWQSYYQCMARCHRYGQTRVVDAHVVLSELEGQIAQNIARKALGASAISEGLVRAMRAHGGWAA